MDTSFVILFRDVYRTRAGSMSRLPARSLLLLRRGVHQTPATRLALFFYIFRSFLCLYIYMENLRIKTLS